MISGAFSFAGIIVLALGKPSLACALIVAFALILGYALDSADGQLARLRGGGSLSGEWLDHMVDAAKLSCLHLAVLICFYRSFHFHSAGWLLIPAGYMVVVAVWFFGIMLVGELRKRKVDTTNSSGSNSSGSANTTDASTKQATKQAEPHSSLLRSLMVLPQDYGFLCIAFLLFFSRDAFLGIYTFLFAGNALLLGGSVVVWYREFSSYDRATRLAAATKEGKS